MADDEQVDMPVDPESPEGESQTPDAPASDSAEEPSADQADAAPASDEPAVAQAVEDNPEADAPDADAGKSMSEEDAEAAMLKMLDDLPAEGQNASPEDIDFGGAEVSNAEFQHLQEPAGDTEPQNIELLMDVDLPISIELGRTKMAIADILALGPGSVVELNKLAGEPVDLLVNNKTVAKGEVVVVEENFGLRITQLMTPEERLKALAEE